MEFEMDDYKVEVSGTNIPYSKGSQILLDRENSKAFTIANNTLYVFEYANKNPEQVIRLPNHKGYAMGEAMLLHVEPIASGSNLQTAIMVKVVQGLWIYLLKKDNLRLAVEDNSFHDVYGWNKPGNGIEFGHFYHDSSILGMMTSHAKHGTRFYAVFMDVLLDGNFPIYPLKTNTNILEPESPNSSRSVLASLRRNSKVAFVSRNRDGLSCFEFNESNGIDLMMKIPLCGTAVQDDAVFFTDLTHQAYNDIVHMNSSGLFVYQYDEGYRFINYNPLFSEEKGWTYDHARTVRFSDINVGGFEDLIFTGPKGITALTYDKYSNSWSSFIVPYDFPQRMRHARVMQVLKHDADTYIYANLQESIYSAKVVQMPLNPPKDNPVQPSENITVLVPHQSRSPQVLEPIIYLRDMNIWSTILNCIGQQTGKPKFSLPLVNLPDPLVKLVLNYDATRGVSDVLGIGWSMPMNLIVMDDGGSIFPEDAVYVLAFQDAMQPLEYLPQESSSVIRTYKISSADNSLKLRAKFYTVDDRWIVDLGSGLKQVYGRTKVASGAVSKDLVWKNWHGPGFDKSEQLQRSRMWYLAEVQDQSDKPVVEFFYDVDMAKANSELTYTRAMYLKKIRDFRGNEVELQYQNKGDDEYIKYDLQDQEGNYNWEPIQTRFLSGYKLMTPSRGTQEVSFIYQTSKGLRFLTEFQQCGDVANSYVAKFEYSTFPKGKFGLKKVHLPCDVKVQFTYSTPGESNASTELKRIEATSDYKVTIGADYVLVSYLNKKAPGQVVLRMFNLDMTEELYTSESNVHVTTKGRWPLLGEYESTKGHEVIRGDDYFGVVLFYADSKWLCLFGHDVESGVWRKEPTCYKYGEEAVIESGTDFCVVADPGSNIDLFEWKPIDSTWKHHTFKTNTNKSVPVISVHKNKFVTYDDNRLSLGHKSYDGIWYLKPLANLPKCIGNADTILERFDLEKKDHKIIAAALRNNVLKFNHNLVALNCLQINNHQLQSLLKLYTINSLKNVSSQKDFIVEQDNLQTIVSNEEKDNEGNYFKFKYEINSNGKFYIKVASFRGPLLEKLREHNAMDQKSEITDDIEKHINSPAKRFFLNLQDYFMSFSDKVIMLRDQKLTFGGSNWQRTNLKENDRKRENFTIPLGDKFILEKVNKNAAISLLEKRTRTTLSQFTVNLTDVRVFYPVYMTAQLNGHPVRLVEFDDTSIREQNIPKTECFSPYSNPYILVTHEGDDDRKTVIFRQQYGLKKFVPNFVVNSVAVVFDNDRKQRATGYEYYPDSAKLMGDTVVYSKFAIIPANDRKTHGWLVQMLTDGSSQAYDNQGRLVRTIPFNEEQRKDEVESDEEIAFRKATTIFDKSGQLEIAQCAPYRLTDEDVGYYGFEDYELNVIGSSKQWNFETSHIIRNGFSLTGKNYLHQSTEPVEGIFQPHNQNIEFVASSWVRLQNATKLPLIGEVTPYLKAIILTSSGEEVESLLSEVKLTLDDWIYLELVVDLPSARRNQQKEVVHDNLKVAIRVGPTLTTTIDIDHVRFVPLVSDINVNIFDAPTHTTTAVINSAGSIHRQLYDAYNTVVGKINEQNQIEELTVYTKATSLVSSRSSVNIRPEMGFHETFAPFAFEKRWTVEKIEPWLIAPYQLEHNGSESSILHLNTQDIATESYGFRVMYSLTGGHAALVINDEVELIKNSTECRIKTKSVNRSIPTKGEILVVKEGNRYLIWIDGGLYIDQTLDTTSTPLKLSMLGSVVIKDLLVFNKALIRVLYQNSVDEPTQEISLESASSIVIKERLYDELGRQRITTQDVRLVRSQHQPLLTQIPEFVFNDGLYLKDSIWKSGILTGMATNIIGHPYGFVETRYATNPLNEKIAVGLAGKDFQIAGSFAKQFSSETTNLFVRNRFPLSTNVSYQVERKLGGIEDITVLNSQGKKIAQYVHVPGSKAIFSTYKLNPDGNLVQSLPPIYFEKVGSFHKTNADLLSIGEEDIRLQGKLGVNIDYDRHGKPIRKTTPDAGALENIYDTQKVLRFVLHYSYDDPKIVETVIYFTYDQVGRLLSTGRLLNTTIPKDQLLNLTIDGNNSEEYQTFNYANFERDINLRGKLLRTVTMNGDEPFAEVINVNEEGAAVDKRIIVPTLTEKPVEIVIKKSYFGGRMRHITYPATFNGKPFTIVYGYDRLGQVNTIGVPENPNKFLKIAHNAAGQVIEEAYEPGSNYTFKQTMGYNEPGFLTQKHNPFQSEEISYTNSSYGDTNRGDGYVTRIQFNTHWQSFAPAAKLNLTPDSFENGSMTREESIICFEALKKAGYLDDKNRQIKAFYPDLEVDFPIICTSGTTGCQVSTVLDRLGFPRKHGYKFGYGAHMDLTKGKYFVGDDEPEPFQPDTFAKAIPKLSTDASRQIWLALKTGQFLIEDPDRINVSTSHGKRSRNSYLGSNLFDDLKRVDPDYVLYTEPLRKFLTVGYFKRQGGITQIQLQSLIGKWLGNALGRNVQSVAADIFKMLQRRNYFIDPLDKMFKAALVNFQDHLPDIVRVLFTYFGRQLGSSGFDVESYEVDSNGNHRIFNTGFEQYSLKYQPDSNRVEGVQYKAFDSPQPEMLFPMQHDSRGNVVKALHKGIKSMEYHPVSNLLQRVVMVDGTIVIFYYDSRGERVLKRLTDANGKVRKELHYLRDEQGQVLVEREVNYLADTQPPAVLVTMYIYGPNGMVGFIRRGQFYSVLTDHQGSVRLIVRDGEVVAAYDYLPYGKLMRIFGDDPESHISYRFTGQEWDSEIGLYNYHARFYDPCIGRFYQIDPKEQYFSPYKYANNSPVSMVDPDGEFAFLIIAIILGIVGAYLGGAAANNSWNPAKWNWKSANTYVGMFFGGVSGALLPGGFVGALSALGLSSAAALAMTTTTGIAIAYLSTASVNGAWNPKDWDFSSPRTWSAAFDGFAMGGTSFGGFRNVGQFYKQLSKSGKMMFVGSSIVVSGGMFVMGGFITDWDVKKPQFWFASVASLAAAPELTIFGLKGFKATANSMKSLKANGRSVYENYKEYWATLTILRRGQHVRSIFKTLKEFGEMYPEIKALAFTLGTASGIGISSYLIASALNNGFRNWNATDMSTYQNILTAIQLTTHAGTAGKQGLTARSKKLQLRKAKKAVQLSDEVAKMSAEAYLDIIKTEKVVKTVKNGKEVTSIERVIPRTHPNYSAIAKLKLKLNEIPNTAMSVVIAGDVVVVAFSSNKAPGLYLVYDHDNLSNPRFRARHIVENNANLGGTPVSVRDDAVLSTKIERAIADVQNGIKNQNKILYIKDNLVKAIAEQARLDPTVEVEVTNRIVKAIDDQIMSNGYVDKKFISETMVTSRFRTEAIRNAEASLELVQRQRYELNGQLNSKVLTPAERKILKDQMTELTVELNKVKKTYDDVKRRQYNKYQDLLYEPVAHLERKLTSWEISNCAEPHALSALQRQTAVFGEEFFKRQAYDVQLDIDYLSTYKLQDSRVTPNGFQRCDNCMVTTSKVRNVLTDDGWMDNLERLTKKVQQDAKDSRQSFQFLLPYINLRKTSEDEKRRQKRSVDGEKPPKWYKRPFNWMQSFRSLPRSKSSESNSTTYGKSLLELGDGLLSKMNTSGALLLADVILAKCQRRKVHQIAVEDGVPENRAVLQCNLLQLFEEKVKKAADLSGIPMSQVNLDLYTMQQVVMELLKNRRFERLHSVLLDSAMDSLDSEVSHESIDLFLAAFEGLKVDQSIEEMFVKQGDKSRVYVGADTAYTGNSGRGQRFDGLSALSHNNKLLD